MIEPYIRPLEADGTVNFYQGQQQEECLVLQNNGNHYGWDNPKNPHYPDRNLPVGDGVGVLICLLFIYVLCKKFKSIFQINS